MSLHCLISIINHEEVRQRCDKLLLFLSSSHLSRTSDHGPGSILLLQLRFGDLGEYPGPGEGVDTSDEMVEEAESQVG